MRTVREVLVQPRGMVVNATGEHPFGGIWPAGTVLSAKTGSGRDQSGRKVQVARRPGEPRARRSWVFVSCVIGGDEHSRRWRLSIWRRGHFGARACI